MPWIGFEKLLTGEMSMHSTTWALCMKMVMVLQKIACAQQSGIEEHQNSKISKCNNAGNNPNFVLRLLRFQVSAIFFLLFLSTNAEIELRWVKLSTPPIFARRGRFIVIEYASRLFAHISRKEGR